MSILDGIKKVFGGQDRPGPAGAGAEHDETPEMSAEIYRTHLEAERAEKDSFFRRSPYSPLEQEDRLTFTGLNYYPPDPAYRFILPLQAAEPEPLTFQTSTGDERVYNRIGTVEFEVEGQPASLALYQAEEDDGLFLPFRDATSARETYGAGRYLEPAEVEQGQILVDFNLAYNPYCAYSPNYSCPLPPFENWLKIPIRAGEKNFKDQEKSSN